MLLVGLSAAMVFAQAPASRVIPYMTSIFAGVPGSNSGANPMTPGNPCPHNLANGTVLTVQDMYGDGCLATDALLYASQTGWSQIVFDSAGNAYFNDYNAASYSLIRKVDAVTGVVTLFAGGLGGAVATPGPCGTYTDGKGHTGPDPAVLGLAPSTPLAYANPTEGDGCPAVDPNYATNGLMYSYFKGIRDLAIDANYLYVADSSNSKVRKISLSNSPIDAYHYYAHEVEPVGGATTTFSVDGSLNTASIHNPYAIAVDSVGNVFVGDQSGNAVRRLSPTTYAANPGGTASATCTANTCWTVGSALTVLGCATGTGTTCAAQGNGNVCPTGSPAGASRNLQTYTVSGLAFDSLGNLYVASTHCYSVYKIAANVSGIVDGTTALTTLMGDGATGAYAGGTWMPGYSGGAQSSTREVISAGGSNLYVINGQSVWFYDAANTANSTPGGWLHLIWNSSSAVGTGCASAGTVANGITYYNCPTSVSEFQKGKGNLDAYGNLYIVDNTNNVILKAATGLDFEGTAPAVQAPAAVPITQQALIHGGDVASGTNVTAGVTDISQTNVTVSLANPFWTPTVTVADEVYTAPTSACSQYNNTTNPTDDAIDCVISLTYTPSGTGGPQTGSLVVTGTGSPESFTLNGYVLATTTPVAPVVTCVDKGYDGTNAANGCVCTTNPTETNLTCGSTTINSTVTGCTYSQVNEGTSLTVTCSNLVLGGSAASNYLLTPTTATTTNAINAVSPILTVSCVGGVYNNTPYSCTGSATAANGVTPVAGTFAFAPGSETNVGSYPETGTFTSGNSNYASGGTATGTLIITQATPVLTATCTGGVFNNSPYSCTTSATGIGGVTVAGSFNCAPGSETNAGSYPETCTFTSSDPNNNYVSGGTATGTLIVTQATPVLTATCTGGVFNNSPYSCTTSATGIGGVTVAGSFNCAPGSETNAGSYPETCTFTSSDPNNNYVSGGTATGTLIVTQATPVLTATCTGGVFNNSPYSCTTSATGIGGVTVAGSFNCAPGSETNAGSYPETCTFTSTDPNYVTGGTATGTLIITKFTPVLTATCTGGVYNNTPYSCTGSATGVGGVTVGGSFVFSPVSETNAGSYPETGTFTSTDPNYATGGTASGTLIITQATPFLSATCPNVAYDGNPHSCSGTATGIGSVPVAGSFNFVPGAEVAINSYPETGTFTSSDPNYASGGTATGTLSIYSTVIGTTQSFTSLTFSLTSPVFGQSVIATATVSGQGATPSGSVTFTVDSDPTQTQTVSLVNGVANLTLNSLSAITHNIVATYNGDTTYATSNDPEQEIVAQATPTIYPNCYPALYDGNAHGCTPVAIGIDGVTPLAGTWTITYNGSSSVPSAYTTYQVSLIFTPSDSNYADNSSSPASSQLLILNPTSEMAIDPGTASIPSWPANPSAVNPQGLAADNSGNLYIADTANNAISEISIDMYGGGTLSNSTLMPLVSSGLSAPQALTVDPFGDIYVADTGSGTIQMVSGSSLIQITDGLTNPRGITSDADGNIYVSDTGTNTVKLVDTNTGNWIVVAGGGTLCSGKTDAVGDGCPATQATLNGPVGLATDTDGNLYIADTGNQVIRKVTMNTTNPALSVITRVAGIVGVAGLTGDNGSALTAKLNNPLNVVVDPANMLYIVDSGNSAVRLVDTTGTIKTWMGTLGTPGSDGADGLSVQGVKLNAPTAIAMDAYGDVYVSDGGNARTIEDDRNVVTLNLGSVAIGATGKATLSAIVNIGSTTLNFQPPWEYETSSTPGEFGIIGQGACNDSGTLAVGASCNLSTAYDPLLSNNPVGGTTEYDTVNLDSDASNSLFTALNLSGTPLTITPVTLNIFCPPVNFDGAAHGCVASATDPSTQAAVPGTWNPLITSLSATNAGTYSESSTFTPTDQVTYEGGLASGSLVIAQATPTPSVTCTGGVYNGTPYSCSGSATGVGGVTVSGTFAFAPGSETEVGSYPETGTFTSSDPNYVGGETASGTLTITTANPVLSVTCTGGVYNGNPYSCTGSATGVGGVPVAGTFTFNPIFEVNAGSYPETGTFTSSNPDYASGGTASGTLTITKATPALSLSCPGGVYNGTPYACSGTATGVGGVTIPGSFSCTPSTETAAGSYPENCIFTSDDSNYMSGGTASGTLIITGLASTLSISCPGGAYNGTPYVCTGTATGLGGITVTGSFSFSYSGAGGTIYAPSTTAPSNVGTYNVTGTFTSTNPDYASGGTISGGLAITQATPVLSISCPGGIYNTNQYSCTGSATGVGGVTVAGTFNFNPASEINAGSYPETASFASSDPNYTSGGTASGTLIITQATPVLSATCIGGAFNGNPYSCTGLATGVGGAPVAGTFAFNPGSETAVGSYPETGTFTATGPSAINYVSGGTAASTLVITAIAPVLSVSCPGGVYNGTPYSCTGTATGLGGITVTGSFAFNPGAETNVGSYPETGTFTSTNPDYASGGTASSTLAITVATPVLSATCTGGAYNATAYSCTGSATGVGGAAVTGTFVFNPASETNVGSYPETGTFTSTNANYASGGTTAGTLTITQATPKVTLTCPAVMFTNTPDSCTVKVTGANNATVTGTTVITYSGSQTAPSAIGSYPVVATFTSSDPNYANSTGTSTLLITPSNPVITNLSPYNATVGGAAFTLTVTGTNFESNAVIEWNGTQLTTTVSSDQTTLTATIPAADLATVGTPYVQVLNPAPSQGTSSVLSPKFTFSIDSSASTTGTVTVTPSTTTLTVTSATGGTVTVAVTAAGATSNAITTANCYNMPTGVTCSYTNGTVTFNVPAHTPTGNYSITIVFTTTETVASLFHGRTFFAAWSGILGLPLGLFWMGGNRKKNLRRLLMVLVGMVLLISLVGCGGKATSTAAPITSQSSTSVTLTVK